MATIAVDAVLGEMKRGGSQELWLVPAPDPRVCTVRTLSLAHNGAEVWRVSDSYIAS